MSSRDRKEAHRQRPARPADAPTKIAVAASVALGLGVLALAALRDDEDSSNEPSETPIDVQYEQLEFDFSDEELFGGDPWEEL